MPSPTDDDRLDLLLSCRYGDLPDIQAFVAAFSPNTLDDVHDDNGNTVLHMAAGNGHTDILDYLLPLVSPRLLTQQNHAGSTALHWAALNAHLGAAQLLVGAPHGPGADMIDIKNGAGRSPLGEAEMAGWKEGARWFVQVMKLDEEKGGERVQVQDLTEDGEGEGAVDPSKSIEVEIQDANEQLARMTIHPDHPGS